MQRRISLPRLILGFLTLAALPARTPAATDGPQVAYKLGGNVSPERLPPGFDDEVALPPAWAFGVLYGNYCGQAELLARVDRLKKDDFPVDAVWVDSAFWDVTTKGPAGYINFKGDANAFPNVRAMCDALSQQKIRFGIWVWDRISSAETALFKEFEQRGFFKGEVIRKNGWHNDKLEAVSRFVDFDNPAAAEFWKEQMRPLMEAGVDFFKLDAGPAESYIRAHFELTQAGRESGGRGFLLTHARRSTLSSIKKYPTAWTGDSLPAWTHPEYPDPIRWVWGGLREQVRMVSDPEFGFYAYPFLTNDTGGFRNMPGVGAASDELYMRWAQFSAFGAIMEVFGSEKFPLQNLPQQFSVDAQAVFRTYTHLRLRLFPYIYTHAHLSRLASRKLIQGQASHPDQYLFGRDFLVAPILKAGSAARSVWLPDGNDWIDYWSGKEWSGGQTVQSATPKEHLPLYVRKGAIIPLRDYAPSVEQGTNAKLTLEVWPKGTSSFCLIEDDGRSEGYRRNEYATTEILSLEERAKVTLRILPMVGNYSGMYTDRLWTLSVHLPQRPVKVLLNGGPVDFQYDAQRAVLTTSAASKTDQRTEFEILLQDGVP